jgi:hypothetical protein
MNERIRILQLADQAYDEYETDATKYEDNIPDEFCKKFAELIVRESAKIAVEQADYCEMKMMPNTVIGIYILKHFGVE